MPGPARRFLCDVGGSESALCVDRPDSYWCELTAACCSARMKSRHTSASLGEEENTAPIPAEALKKSGVNNIYQIMVLLKLQ